MDISITHEIVLTTRTGGETHDGYCSGSESNHKPLRPRKNKKIVAIPPSFSVPDYWKRDGDAILICPSNPQIKNIIGTYPIHGGCPTGGSGFCGCKTVEKIVDARIVPKSTL
jgi:hypothetical protein